MKDDERTSKEDLNKIFDLRPLIQQRRRKACDCKNRTYSLDTNNREVTCKKCGQVVDPFDALIDIVSRWESIERYLILMQEEQQKMARWLVNHKEPLAVKPLIEKYRRGLLPYCPHCNKMLDIYNLTSWGNKKFLEKNGE